MTAMHYSGGVEFVRGKSWHQHLPGWPACTSGRSALRVRRANAQTRDKSAVTCKRCLQLVREAEAYDRRLAAEQERGG